jgi:pyruvate/2-oxoglutarate dehydrogenase complex dihydrolipoamide acyltransferase (E2) component
MDVLMPQLGETVAEGKITTWFKTVGDTVKPGDNLFEIETDKVSMEVPATAPGVLTEIRVPAGEVAPVGFVVAVLRGEGDAVAKVGATASPLPIGERDRVRGDKSLDSPVTPPPPTLSPNGERGRAARGVRGANQTIRAARSVHGSPHA